MFLSDKPSKTKVHLLKNEEYDGIVQILQGGLKIKERTQALLLTKQSIQKKSKNYKLDLNSKYVLSCSFI